MSSKQVERTLGVTYKTAWFLTHRIREAMREGGLVPPPALGGERKIVEAHETYFGKYDTPRPRVKKRYSSSPSRAARGRRTSAILALVERGGSVRSSMSRLRQDHRERDCDGQHLPREPVAYR